MAKVTERDREAANRLFFLCGSLGDFDAACAFLAEWREARLAEERAARLKAEGERDAFKRIGLQFETDARKHFEQSCKNLASAEAAKARLRAVIEALRAVHGECPGWIEVCGSAHDPRCDGTCSVGCPVPVREQEKCQLCDLLGRDAQASPEPEGGKP